MSGPKVKGRPAWCGWPVRRAPAPLPCGKGFGHPCTGLLPGLLRAASLWPSRCAKIVTARDVSPRSASSRARAAWIRCGDTGRGHCGGAASPSAIALKFQCEFVIVALRALGVHGCGMAPPFHQRGAEIVRTFAARLRRSINGVSCLHWTSPGLFRGRGTPDQAPVPRGRPPGVAAISCRRRGDHLSGGIRPSPRR